MYSQLSDRYAENYTRSRIEDLLDRGRFERGFIFTYCKGAPLGFNALEHYQPDDSLFVTRAGNLVTTQYPITSLLTLLKMKELALKWGMKGLGGSVNDTNKNLTRLMSRSSLLKGTIFEKDAEQYASIFKNLVFGEKKIYNSVEQQFYFIPLENESNT